MPRYDKYDPISGGFRALLAGALPITGEGFFGAVSLNASAGRVVPGNQGQSGIVGVCVKNVRKGPVGSWGTDLRGGVNNPSAPIGAMTGDAVDIMTSGEIVDLDPDVFLPATKFYAQPDGSITAANGAGAVPIGHTVQAGRLIVRVAHPLTASA